MRRYDLSHALRLRSNFLKGGQSPSGKCRAQMAKQGIRNLDRQELL